MGLKGSGPDNVAVAGYTVYRDGVPVAVQTDRRRLLRQQHIRPLHAKLLHIKQMLSQIRK